MKNANSTEVSRVKIPKLNYASTKKPLWLKGQSDMGSTPIILPPLPPKMDTPRNSTRMSGQHRASFHQASGYLSDQQQKRRGDSKHLTPRSNRKTGLEFNVIKEMDVTHSIRNKIEQYRKWHDAHHKEPQTPRRKMTVAATQGTRQGENELTARRGRKPEVGDLLTGKPDVVMQMPQTGNSRAKRPVRGKSTDISAKSLQVRTAGRTASSSPASVPSEIIHKKHSATSWRTWRDVNDSYCYTDVKQYIKENELMDDDKERVIQRWVTDVYESMNEEDRYDIDPSSTFP